MLNTIAQTLSYCHSQLSTISYEVDSSGLINPSISFVVFCNMLNYEIDRNDSDRLYKTKQSYCDIRCVKKNKPKPS